MLIKYDTDAVITAIECFIDEFESNDKTDVGQRTLH